MSRAEINVSVLIIKLPNRTARKPKSHLKIQETSEKCKKYEKIEI